MKTLRAVIDGRAELEETLGVPEGASEEDEVLDEEFLYEVEDGDRYEPRFFNYRRAWYDAFEFEYIYDRPCYAPFRDKWTAVQTTSYFTGVVIRWHREFESVIVGRYSV